MTAEETKQGDVPKSKRPKSGPFYQQELAAWQPILTPNWVIGIFVSIGVLFIAIGIPLKVASDDVVEYEVQYDGSGTPTTNSGCQLSPTLNKTTCTVTFQVTEKMEQPIYLYYQLENFYQNHRRYVQSRSDAQLRGDIESGGALNDCDPLTDGPAGTVRNPCGLIAGSFFNDTFVLQASGLTMLETDIAWDSDVNDKFENPDNLELSSQYYLYQMYPEVINKTKNVEDEHFIVWMRTAALPTFRKLYGRIEQDIPAGTTIQFDVTARFRVDPFDGKKSLVLSTTSFMGGKNSFLGIAYLAVGSICIFLGLVFTLKQIISPRKLGDARSLEWAN